MASAVAQYKGFILTVNAFKMAQGYAPRVTLTRHNGKDTTEQFFDVQTTGQGIPEEAEALQVAIDYGNAAIDGKIPGIDISKMY